MARENFGYTFGKGTVVSAFALSALDGLYNGFQMIHDVHNLAAFTLDANSFTLGQETCGTILAVGLLAMAGQALFNRMRK